MNTTQKKTIAWTKNRLNAIKKDVKTTLDEVLAKGGHAERLDYALKKIRSLEGDDTADGQMERFVYCISALTHQERYGGLTPAHIPKIADIAQAILKVQGIQPTTSRVASVFGELHLVLSQLYRKEGRHWESGWEHHVSRFLSESDLPGGHAFQNLVMANRTLRLAQTEAALEYYKRAESGAEENQALGEQARISRIRALRISGRLEEAEDLSKQTAPLLENWSENGKQELAWEATCREVQQTGRLGPMMVTVKRDGSHWKGSYVLEGFFWVQALFDEKWISSYPRIRTLLRRRELNILSTGFVYEIARDVEIWQEKGIPLFVQLRQIGDILGQVGSLITIDLEMLVLASASKWLAQMKVREIADFVHGRYRNLSLCLSSGKNDDTLSLFCT